MTKPSTGPVMPGTNLAAYGAVAVECEHGFDVCPNCDALGSPLTPDDVQAALDADVLPEQPAAAEDPADPGPVASNPFEGMSEEQIAEVVARALDALPPAEQPYFAGEWRGRPVFECPERCGFARMQRWRQIDRHVQAVHLTPAPATLTPEERAARSGLVIAKR